MTKIKITSSQISLPDTVADLLTPVGAYMLLRDKFPNSLLLESSSSQGKKNSMSYIAFDEIAHITVDNMHLKMQYAPSIVEEQFLDEQVDLANLIKGFTQSFEFEGEAISREGLYGYSSFEALKYFDNIKFTNPTATDERIPEMRYAFHRYVLAFNHFNHQVELIENLQDGEVSKKHDVITLLLNKNVASYTFDPCGEESSNLTDEEYLGMVRKGKEHCFRGDVFQIVLSRRFEQSFKGDDFNVYRALRKINPSPYLFYFDFGDYKIFGSSPEAQIVVEGGEASINPIAGTFKRTGDDEQDRLLAKELANDEKENAEHIMLVDLARNDLSRTASNVTVDVFREVQYYSHVLHLVSEVSGKLHENSNSIKVFGDTFPAGTLSGAPKYKAIQLIDKYENTPRQFYGGAIGIIRFNGDVNQAITIRSFMSKSNTLYYQAGAGVVAKSNEESELQEVNNKLGALKAAVRLASEFKIF